MNQHLEQWIDAYLDGELTEKQQMRFEKHLETCPECLRLMEEREKLSSLLAEFSLPEPQKTTEQFVQDLNLLLPREQNRAGLNNRKSGLWIIVSIGFLLGIFFLQSINMVSNVLIWFPGIDRFVDLTTAAPGFLQNLSPWVELFLNQAAAFSGWGWIYRSLQFSTLALTIVLVLVYISWMTFWLSTQVNNKTA